MSEKSEDGICKEQKREEHYRIAQFRGKWKTIVYNFVNVSPFIIGQQLTKVMDIDFTATEETSAAFQCEMLLEVIKPEIENEEIIEEVVASNPELSIVYKMNDETIDNFMPSKTCLYGKHIVTLFFQSQNHRKQFKYIFYVSEDIGRDSFNRRSTD